MFAVGNVFKFEEKFKNIVMKALCLLLFLLLAAVGKSEDTIPSSTYFYINVGINLAPHQADGYQFGLTFSRGDKHVFRLQHIKNGNFSEQRDIGNSSVSLGVTTAHKSYSLMYDYKIIPNSHVYFAVAFGIIGGKEVYRTKKTETTHIGCGSYNFFGSCSKALKFNYIQRNYMGLIINFKMQLKPPKAFIGCSIDPFIVINNHSNINFGFAINVVVGKIH